VNAQRWGEIQAGFDAIVELSPTERANRLDSLASTDPEMHEALQSLLRSDAEATRDLAPVAAAFLKSPEWLADPQHSRRSALRRADSKDWTDTSGPRMNAQRWNVRV
jgi:hypothetical protein